MPGCSKCKENLSRTAFSRKQVRKPYRKRKCRLCTKIYLHEAIEHLIVHEARDRLFNIKLVIIGMPEKEAENWASSHLLPGIQEWIVITLNWSRSNFSTKGTIKSLVTRAKQNRLNKGVSVYTSVSYRYDRATGSP